MGVIIEYPRDDMQSQRRAAFQTAIRWGNNLTGSITSSYSDVEMRSWPAQEVEARAVLAGADLNEDAILPLLAADKGVTIEDYAAGVVAKANGFRAIAVAGVRLRRGAEKLLSPAIETPMQLAVAVATLRADALAAADELGISINEYEQPNVIGGVGQ